MSVVVGVLFGQKSPHGPLKLPCTDCHTTESWKVLAAPMKFNHSTTGFTLTDAHTNVPCVQCHTNKRFAGTSSDCFSCHANDYTRTLDPNHLLGRFSHDCMTCHTMNVWRPSIFQHSKTNFQLVGAHLSVPCSSCHTNDRFAGLHSDCYSCHYKDFQQAAAPNHITGKFSRECLTCHMMAAWQPSTFDHNKTNFRLTGAHQTLECGSCHGNGVFRGLPQDCYSCHQTQFASAASPDHAKGQFSHACETCHTTGTWTPSTFDHSKTSFSLTGAHAAVECFSCHTNGQFAGLATDCYSCHQKDFTAVVSPSHTAGQFSHDCLTCHSLTQWKPSTFDHTRTIFPLVGAHATAECASCHANGQFKGLPTDCYTCHQQDFAKVVTPNHVTGQYSHDCTTCHSLTVWTPSTFNHFETNFPLTGAHNAVDCATCHVNGQFKGTSADCYSCHQKNFTTAAIPNHTASQFSHDCVTCHTTVAWKPATFDHNTTSFPLVGAHASTDCASCHSSGVFKGLPTDCYSCHQTDYAGTATPVHPSTPNHVTGQLSHDCTACHTTTTWYPSTFNHANTNFPLTGAHAAVACVNCHSNGQFTAVPTDCYSCHQSDFAGVTDPNHVAGGFDHNCLTCHSTTAWNPATFDHGKTNFPLTGAHVSVQCSGCHSSGQFAGTSTDCYVCHNNNYTTATDPNHVAGQYPTVCVTCHNTTAWQPWIFAHDSYFRINSHHRNRAACADCHRVAGSFTSFSYTTGCHSNAHNQNQACYPCHRS